MVDWGSLTGVDDFERKFSIWPRYTYNEKENTSDYYIEIKGCGISMNGTRICRLKIDEQSEVYDTKKLMRATIYDLIEQLLSSLEGCK